MFKATALTAAVALLTLQASSASASGADLLAEEHYSQDGYQVDLYVTDGAEGLLAEATLADHATGESVDMWTDGELIHWHGIVDGAMAQGSMPIADIDSAAPDPQPYCFTPVTAVVCIGVVILSAAVSNCAHTSNICPVNPEPEVPGGAGGVPDDGGDGDGDSGKGGTGSGGDED